MNPLDLLERVAPHLAYYPRWARALFFTAFAFVVASIGIYAVGYSSAQRRQEAAKVSVAVTPAVMTARTALNADELEVLSSIRDPFSDELSYVDAGERGRSHFVPHQEYLDRLRSGQPVEALSGLSLQPWTGAMRPAAFDVKVANNTDSTLLFTEAVLEVRRSTPDLRPVLVPMVLLERFRRLTVVNYGWGTVPSVKLNARVNVADAPRSSNVIELGPLVGTAEADLTPAFREAGFDIAALRRYEAETPSDLAVARRALEPFGLDPERDVDVPVEGAISYRQGTERPGLVRFTARVPATRPTGLGDFQPPTARYSIVELATDDSLYERRVPLAKTRARIHGSVRDPRLRRTVIAPRSACPARLRNGGDDPHDSDRPRSLRPSHSLKGIALSSASEHGP